MLVNFCDKVLRTDVTCSAVSTEGYEVTNLTSNDSEKGFLAYSCIRPPITIDFNFICNIKLSHVLVWPQVGAQKSSGFKLSVKSADASNQPFVDVSTGFLQKQESGIFFFRKDISHYAEVQKPSTFAERYIKSLAVTNYVSTLRLSILKTDNSVPAVSKIEIWGLVSPKCPRDVVMNVMALLANKNKPIDSTKIFKSTPTTKICDKDQDKKCEQLDKNLEVPEDFLDPITLDIMTQPVILPSGKIIDQKTLEKHGHNEAVWGRPVSDPFTGIPFSDVRKPIAAFPLKERIDKFLLENSNTEEVKKLPRVLGCKMTEQNETIKVIGCVNNSPVNIINRDLLKRTLSNQEDNSCVKKSRHLLPVISLSSRNSLIKPLKMTSVAKEGTSQEDIKKRNAEIEDKLYSKIQIFNTPTCGCCSNCILYQLPCKHVICRKALLALEKNQCTTCKQEFKKSDPQRFHVLNGCKQD
ncbi:RING finger protein 37 [Copidosoma floridanum]|uniref:RING finger protein 37 n=1 Tax=Copidosoma floridanum TaxID=29053 RepID=UPI0006C9B999|nr:RING finger protein 37 [Copidosoma floridanum]